MGYLPIFLDLGGRPCMVIGGDKVAQARVRVLLDAGATVTVVSSEAADEIKSQAAAGKVRLLDREYEYGDLRGSWLVYVATTNAEVARCAAREARELGIPLNVVDDAESSTFISPAAFRRGDLQIAISTGGSSPAVASMMRQHLEQEIGPAYALVLQVMRSARQFVRVREPNQSVRGRILKSLAEALLKSVDALDYPLIDEALRLHLGAGVAELGLNLQNGSPSGTMGAADTRH
jgi:precorrin-2 dehydrogenase / sirohydrochlorin ferrochelatase